MTRRIAALTTVAILGLVACDPRGDVVAPSPSPASSGQSPTSEPPPPPGSPTPTESLSPSSSPRPIPPAWAVPIDEDLAPENLDDASLVPEGALLIDRVTLPAGGDVSDQVAASYVIGTDPFAAEHGVALWQRFAEPPVWSVVLAFVDPPARGVLGIRMQSGDLTGDGHDDLLTFEETGGSGACGRWRVVTTSDAESEQVFSRQTCDTEIVLAGRVLQMREAVFDAGDPHCCPSAFRTTTLEWDGNGFVETAVDVEPVD